MSKHYNKAKIGEIVAKIKELKLSYHDGAKQFNIPVRHIYRYNNELKHASPVGCLSYGASVSSGEPDGSSEKTDESAPAGSAAEMADKDKVESSLPEEIQTIIVNYRKENQEHGYQRIEDYLRDRYFIKVRRKEIRKVLKVNGLERVLDSSFDKSRQPAKGSRRFEADAVGELYQMDLSYVYVMGLPVCYLILIIDDYSRFVVGHELVGDQKSLTMINALHRSIERYGKPQKLLTDQSGSFFSWSFEHTLFQSYLDNMKIEHLVCDPHSPETQGKVERMTQTIQKELLQKTRFKSYDHGQSEIDAYIDRYNYSRPHQGVGGLCPSDRFHQIAEANAQVEQELLSSSLDLSKGYLILKDPNHNLSVVFSEKTIRVFLNGQLLRQQGDCDGQ